MRRRLTGADSRRREILLVADSGGHLNELLALREVWGQYSRAWVTVANDTFGAVAPGELVFAAHGPTRRSPLNLARNTLLALRIIRAVRPSAIITTGAGLSVPFVWVGKLLGVRAAYIECSGRIGVSLSGRLVAPAASRIYVQWAEATDLVGNARYCGSIFFSPR